MPTLSTTCLTLVFVATYLSAACTSWAQGKMPEVHAESLAEVKVTLPRDLPGERTLVFMGFEFDHQKKMDQWVAKMELREDNRAWVQLHVIGRVWGLIGGFVNSRKRPYFHDAYQRERVIPVYANVSEFITAMGFADSVKSVYVAVVARDGSVLATAAGDFDPVKALGLKAALDGK
jgi:hypothetical protein